MSTNANDYHKSYRLPRERGEINRSCEHSCAHVVGVCVHVKGAMKIIRNEEEEEFLPCYNNTSNSQSFAFTCYFHE